MEHVTAKHYYNQVLPNFAFYEAPNQPKGKLVSIDLLPMHSVEGATVISPADFTSAETQKRVTEILSGCYVDVILSDMVNQ